MSNYNGINNNDNNNNNNNTNNNTNNTNNNNSNNSNNSNTNATNDISSISGSGKSENNELMIQTAPGQAPIHTGKALSVHNVSKAYTDGTRSVTVLHGLSLEVAAGQRVAILGASGSGKSTLLHLLGGLDMPDTGQVLVGNDKPVNWATLTEAQRATARNERVGFVYQFHHLLPEFSALENVAMPLRWRGLSAAKAQQQAAQWLARVGLSARQSHIPAELSGGERQRVAVARALVTEPHLVLADEPTGNLDAGNAAQVFNLFLELATQSGTALVLVTHDEALAAQCDAAYRMAGGALVKV
jgi:lipoprotein-releasing system ATP-binding protein